MGRTSSPRKSIFRLASSDGEAKFKENELRRRVGLESVSTHKGQEHSKLNLGDERKVKLQQIINASSDVNKDASVTTSRRPISRFNRASEASQKEAKNRSQAGRKNKTEKQRGNLAPIWYERICELDGVTDAETYIVQNEVLHTETKIMSVWAKGAQKLVELKSSESKLRDNADLQELKRMILQLDKEIELAWIRTDAIASIINTKERKAIKASSNSVGNSEEKDIIKLMENKRRDLIYKYFKRFTTREQDLKEVFSEGAQMLHRFGKLFHSACENLANNNKAKLFEALHKHGIEIGRMHATDASNKLHRKITLNPLDKSNNIDLGNNNLTLILKDGKEDEWEVVHATDGPWRVQRYDTELLQPIVQNVRTKLPGLNSHMACKALAQVLDAVNLGSSPLTKEVSEAPHKARELIQRRIKSLGIRVAVEGEDSFTRLRKEEDIRNACYQVIDEVEARLQYHGRFYYEIYAHPRKSESQFGDANPGMVSKGTSGKRWNWTIGVSFKTLACTSFPGADEYSFGFRYDGTVWHNGLCTKYTSTLSYAIVLGVLIDLNTGSLSLYADGQNLGPAFGVDSVVYSPDEQLEQGRLIRNNHLIPSFALQNEGKESMSNQNPKSKKRNPSMSVNFGGFSFSTTPPDATSCESYLSFVVESKARRASIGNNMQDTLKNMQIENQEEEPEETRGNEDLDEPIESLDEENAQENYSRVLEYQQRIDFFNRLEYDQVQSWSNFPPKSQRLGYSANVLQRACRRYLGYKWRQRERKRILGAARKIQLRVLKAIPHWRTKRTKAIIRIQRMWRGHKSRALYKIVRKLQIHPDKLLTAIVKVQSCIRKRRAKVFVDTMHNELNLKVFWMINAAIKIQTRWRDHKVKGEHVRFKTLLIATKNLQRCWRGHKDRQNLSPEEAKRLATIGTSILTAKQRQKAAKEIQRRWRGHADRTYAAMRKYVYITSAKLIQEKWKSYRIKTQIDELCDAGPAEAIKKFLKLLKVIS